MEMRELRYFIAVAREGSITKAAESLFITQPSLSRQLTMLEEKFGVQLFVRGNRSTELTEKGKLLYQYALEIIDLVDKTEREIKENESITGEIVIGSGICESVNILSDIMNAFSKEYPLVKFDLVTGTRDQIIEKMDMGLIDIGLIIGFVGNEKYQSIKLGINEQFVLLMKKDSPLAEKDYVIPKDITNIPLSLPKSNSSRFLLDWYGNSKDKLKIYTTHDLLDNTIPLIKKGLCNVITLKANAEPFAGKELVFKPLKPEVYCESYFIWSKHKVRTETVSRFIEFMNEYFEIK